MDSLRAWMRRDPPPGELLAKVAEFGAELERSPETGDIDREHANLFVRRIPGTEHDNRIVAISFSVQPSPDPDLLGEVHCQDVTCVEHPREALFEPWPPKPHH